MITGAEFERRIRRASQIRAMALALRRAAESQGKMPTARSHRRPGAVNPDTPQSPDSKRVS